MQTVRKAVIPAAGLGTRFLPATKAIPKEMLPIVDRPAIQHIVEEAVAAGIEEVLIITSERKPAIEEHFTKNSDLELFLKGKGKESLAVQLEGISNLADIEFTYQPHPLGLGHAVQCAKSFVGDEPFAVLLGDCLVRSPMPCIKQLIDIFINWNADVFAVRHLSPSEVHRCGVVDAVNIAHKLHRVHDLVEKPSLEEAPSLMGIVGRYVLTPAIFDALERQTPGVGGEIQLTDALKQLCIRPEAEVMAYEFDGTRYDIGDKLGYMRAIFDFALDDPTTREEIVKTMTRV